MNAPDTRSTHLGATPRACESCTSPINSTRRWARFCSDACRAEWHRKKKLGTAGRIAELERKVAELEERMSALDRPVR